MIADIKTKFIRWSAVVLALWAMSELGVAQLKPHIPWLVGLTWVWAAMLPILDDEVLDDNPLFIRLMIVYATSGVAVAFIVPLFFQIDDDYWLASIVFHGSLVSVSGLAFLVYRFGKTWGDAGPAVGALALAGVALRLVDRYTLLNSLLLELSIAFLLTASATFCLFFLVSVLSATYNGAATQNGPPYQVHGEEEVAAAAPKHISALYAIDDEADDGDNGQESDLRMGEQGSFFTVGSLPVSRIVRSMGSLFVLLLLLAVLFNLAANLELGF